MATQDSLASIALRTYDAGIQIKQLLDRLSPGDHHNNEGVQIVEEHIRNPTLNTTSLRLNINRLLMIVHRLLPQRDSYHAGLFNVLGVLDSVGETVQAALQEAEQTVERSQAIVQQVVKLYQKQEVAMQDATEQIVRLKLEVEALNGQVEGLSVPSAASGQAVTELEAAMEEATEQIDQLKLENEVLEEPLEERSELSS
ncbi:hypothetical protein PG993_011713 [Apiospora rasikravindrae]|uniref:Uncharacterized protein n=1 Tax=Apiospora rasikravindrae TaxID=990691 RepID=A0ABR1S1Q2_9PEZI